MEFKNEKTLKGGVFITFSGNCKAALMLYHSCFGGELYFETFDEPLDGYTGSPVIRGSLVSDSIIVHGSDLVHNEGRKIGNYLSVFLPCKNAGDRNAIIVKLKAAVSGQDTIDKDQQLIEVTDAFDVRWILGV